ncbi:hypothetical protein L1987_53718 [Smallanthus sonchifolius]|uniref:Uncharacterized protein n=1 Tax=Smallanthus sonchifolius TaxID=185202 RepID=A0ACB9EWM4_9ASTR|nr:hypothetical protein L1987_53718 [Smallanthus sonchifolius]
MLSKLSRSSVNQLEIELMDAGKKLLHLSSSSIADINNVLAILKQNLSKVEQSPSVSMKDALSPTTEALIAKELMRHPDMDVNISVACCFCDILRIYAPDPPYNDEQLMDIFEMVVIVFEKFSASGGCYTEMAEVLKIFSDYKLFVLMLELDSDAHGLIVRLFKQFLTVADSNSSAIVFKMEEIMTMIIEESDELGLELVGLLVTFLKNNNPIASPVCWQLGEKVLMNFGARFKPHLPNMGHDMSIALYDYSRMVASICKTASENDTMEDKETTQYTTEQSRNVKTHKIKIECLETASRCQHEEKTDSFYNPQKIVTWVVKGKRKRNKNPLKKEVSFPKSGIVSVQGYKVKQSIAQILETVFKKHGDIAAKCIFKTTSVRSSILEVVCEVVRRIQTNNVTEKMEEIECQVLVAEAANVDVSWLRAHFEAILLMEMKANTILVKRAAQMDLRESCAELLAAQERFKEARRCARVLHLVEKNLNDNILESKAKLDVAGLQPNEKLAKVDRPARKIKRPARCRKKNVVL